MLYAGALLAQPQYQLPGRRNSLCGLGFVEQRLVECVGTLDNGEHLLLPSHSRQGGVLSEEVCARLAIILGKDSVIHPMVQQHCGIKRLTSDTFDSNISTPPNNHRNHHPDASCACMLTTGMHCYPECVRW
mmetsp:Transcript_20231/g.61626  ORF Transcript_20231/g.61626 Transcript_20231/m.61626 type:complete len:131 (-) Transcript_20231:336-728(-)